MNYDEARPLKEVNGEWVPDDENVYVTAVIANALVAIEELQDMVIS